jgi:hypothetical protein
MSSTTCLSIKALNVNNSELVSRYNTSLIKTKAVLLFGLTLVHESFRNINTFMDETVGLVFNS